MEGRGSRRNGVGEGDSDPPPVKLGYEVEFGDEQTTRAPCRGDCRVVCQYGLMTTISFSEESRMHEIEAEK